jgi:hypothetical protein
LNFSTDNVAIRTLLFIPVNGYAMRRLIDG